MRDSTTELVRTVQALASSADLQRSLFPAGVCVGDELALEFADASRDFLDQEPRLTRDQREALVELDSYLLELSGEWNADFWGNLDRLSRDPRWNAIRDKAKTVLDVFGWPNEPPERDPRDRVIYVRGRS